MIPEKWVWRHIHSFIHSKIFFHSKARCHEKRMAFLTYVWSANWFYIFKILQQRATNFSKWHPNFKIRWHLLRHACQLASVQSILFKNVKCRVLRKTFFLHCLVSLLRTARLWIRIRIHFPFWIRIQEITIWGKEQDKCKEIVVKQFL